MLPNNSITLDGSRSTDDQGIVSYLWIRDGQSPAAGVSTDRAVALGLERVYFSQLSCHSNRHGQLKPQACISSQFWRLQRPGQGAGEVPSWFIDSLAFCVQVWSGLGVGREGSVWPLYKHTNLKGSGPYSVTPMSLNYLIIGLSSRYSTIQCQGSTM